MRRIVIGFCAAAALVGCGDPLRDVPRLQDVPVAETAGQADVLPSPEATAPALVEAEKPRGGLLGFLRGRADAAKSEEPDPQPERIAAPVAVETVADAAEDPVELAAVPAPKPRRGLFGGGGSAGATKPSAKAPKPGAPDYEQVAFGTRLPYGRVARVCDAPVRSLGKASDSYPERGRGYTLYDSAPGSESLRTFYLTGFDDGCPRQFTAALVIFGDPESYEQLRYGPAGKQLPVSKTDTAYETVKGKVCRVGKGKPCGSRMSQLAKTTVFVSVYERFGSNPRWKNILLHDGAVLAVDVKG